MIFLGEDSNAEGGTAKKSTKRRSDYLFEGKREVRFLRPGAYSPFIEPHKRASQSRAWPTAKPPSPLESGEVPGLEVAENRDGLGVIVIAWLLG